MFYNSILWLSKVYIDNASFTVTAATLSPPSPPGLLRGICPPFQSRGWGICKFCAARGPGICKPRGYAELLTRTHFPIRIKLLLNESRLALDLGQGQGVVKACSRFYACISSLPHQARITQRNLGAIDVNQRFLQPEIHPIASSRFLLSTTSESTGR